MTTRQARKTTMAKNATDDLARSAAPEPKDDKYVYYISREPEPISFRMLIRGRSLIPGWDKRHERLIWRVPKELASAFEMHSHFVTSRIIRAKE
jgi:hypothetical protein